ncbi:thioredoxin [Staphylococcus petrasii]|uniref:Thioredoxin n=1 Tax=Staphylococcus petrasii TaxID=1276936 RepID=A0A380FXV4_9STAP|nr:thioredoxin family protein [Staphylococcus petrasii]MCI2774357.1 thioredoxin family protein [Staphylococcus petrasii]PNZ30101.1 thiol reductase thioredoxin [Staphylococcus petrasii]PNZ81548.1 thiol reductase thioredoxin [Staphylococcus petrasii]TGA81635.1 thioredoxin [Staphylococcus petrasii]TGE13624.1 thioredoxin [Staphylococcus petrasii]
MTEQLNSIEQFHQFIETHPLAVIHVMRDHCSVCHAVLPQIQDIVSEYSHATFGVINQSKVEAIAGELSIFTVPVDLIFLDGKEMHRQARFIDMQSFEHQLQLMNDSLER